MERRLIMINEMKELQKKLEKAYLGWRWFTDEQREIFLNGSHLLRNEIEKHKWQRLELGIQNDSLFYYEDCKILRMSIKFETGVGFLGYKNKEGDGVNIKFNSHKEKYPHDKIRGPFVLQEVDLDDLYNGGGKKRIESCTVIEIRNI